MRTCASYLNLGQSTEERKQRLKDLWGQYGSQKQIAKALGVRPSTVSHWFARHQLAVQVTYTTQLVEIEAVPS